jgi:hypothetical protein
MTLPTIPRTLSQTQRTFAFAYDPLSLAQQAPNTPALCSEFDRACMWPTP